ncbi:MAG: discoidin domain-containing protein [bacterium]
MRQHAWPIAALAVVLMGLVVFSTRASPIQPIERLPGGIAVGPSIEAITATSAVVTMKTTAPAFCQLNYGPTPQYGQMRRMTMSGPMSDHRILLPGLQPDTVYHVRITAVDVQARIYQSGDLTFKTLAAAANRPAGRNVASVSAGARVVGVSSNYRGQGIAGTYGGNQAIDGDPATEWSSNGDGDAAWIEVELARPYRISAIGFWTRTMGSTAQIQEFDVVADGKIRLGPFTLRDAAGMHYFPVDVMAKRLRFNARKSNGGKTGALEVEVLAAP